MATTLVVTNDFPPRIGGIERFVEQVCSCCDDDVVVLTSSEPGASAFDAGAAYEIVRRDRVLLPSPTVAREARALLRRTGADRVVFGAAAPLALLADDLRRAGAQRIVALSHGHETWWAQVPGARHLLRRIASGVDALTAISTYTADRIRPALDPRDQDKLTRLAPPVDTTFFRPPTGLDARSGLDERAPLARCVAVGRLVRRKGIDVLLRAWPEVRARVPHAELVVVGDGPQRARLVRLANRLDLVAAATFSGSRGRAGVRQRLWQADVFALPMRVRLGGLDSEGLGLAALEAAACGLPTVVGASGGAPETVIEGVSGFVVEPDDAAALAARLIDLFGDPRRCATMGVAGRRHVEQHFGTTSFRRRLRELLALD